MMKHTYLLIGLQMLLAYCCASIATAQQSASEGQLAHVWPVNNGIITRAEGKARLFSDQAYTLKTLPQLLKGTSFITTSHQGSSCVKPVTSGTFYFVTPEKGQPNSQEELLTSKGFAKVSHPTFKLFDGQSERITILKGKISGKFEQLCFDGWAIPFFSAEPLPSIAQAANVIWKPQTEYSLKTRKWQGCPTIEKTGNRLWTGWFSGGKTEPDKGNYAVVALSDDDGKTWIDPALIIAHPDTTVRVMDTQIWKDPQGRLWIFWVQNTGNHGFDGIWGTWAIRLDNPESAIPTWTKPRRLADGLTRNKVTVLASGEWLLPSYNWINNQSTVYVSRDRGETWTLQGGPLNESSYFFEHMVVELNTGRLWMLQRRMKESFSDDKGKNWTELKDKPEFTSPDSRLFIRRLTSGNLLLVFNEDKERKTRKNIVAKLSEDDGHTWPYTLVIDERTALSYPDAIQDNKGVIYLSYDRSRTGEKEILLTSFTEADVKAGKYISPASEPYRVISKAP
ncbi:hypothetical protein GCM10028807_03190 [Spirosoma daeguense]